MNEQKQKITSKLFDALHELKLRTRDSSQAEIQRMFGVVLGLRIALIELNKLAGNPPCAFAGSIGIGTLIDDGFGQKKLRELREYQFPEF